MSVSYKILGQSLNRLVYTCPENTNTIISKLKIKNTSYPANINVNIGPSSSFNEELDEFNPSVNEEIYIMVIQADGKSIIGGGFTTVNGITRNYIARLNFDGTLDTGFNPNFNSFISSIAIQPDGKILVGGQFTTVGGTTRNRIARLNSDGTLDTGFNASVANNSVRSITPQPNGKIFIGGSFTTVNGTTRNRIALLNSDGTLDTGFNASITDNDVDSIVVQPDGKILVGGTFLTVDGTTRNRIARLNSDGTLDTGFNPNLNGPIRKIVLRSDGKIFIGGSFSAVGGTAIQGIALLNADGTIDTSFNANVKILAVVNAIVIQPNNKILIGGTFREVDNTNRERIARLNSDGSLDTGFNPSANNIVFEIALYPGTDSKILVGGRFTTIGDITRIRLARLSLSPIDNSTYLIKNKVIEFNNSIEINGGIGLEEDQILLVDSPDGQDIIIQAYGIEDTV
jgi:uncharacterized delta-60 repeat protein